MKKLLMVSLATSALFLVGCGRQCENAELFSRGQQWVTVTRTMIDNGLQIEQITSRNPTPTDGIATITSSCGCRIGFLDGVVTNIR